MATAAQCRAAITTLTAALDEVEPQLRAKHVPRRTIACCVTDLELTFVGRLDEHGVHDVTESAETEPDVDVRLTTESDVLVALADGEDDFLHAWIRGRLHISAGVRDLLRLRSLVGL